MIKVCQPKDRGGLGLRNLKDTNRVALTGTFWQLLWSVNSLWAKVLFGKCGNIRDIDLGKLFQT